MPAYSADSRSECVRKEKNKLDFCIRTKKITYDNAPKKLKEMIEWCNSSYRVSIDFCPEK